jgi:hypothetical protein
MDVTLHASLISEIYEGESSETYKNVSGELKTTVFLSTPAGSHGIHFIKLWVCPRVGLEALERE